MLWEDCNIKLFIYVIFICDEFFLKIYLILKDKDCLLCCWMLCIMCYFIYLDIFIMDKFWNKCLIFRKFYNVVLINI